MVAGAKRGFIGHLVLHQGTTPFDYSMHVGALDVGEDVTVKVSPLTAASATRRRPRARRSSRCRDARARPPV